MGTTGLIFSISWYSQLCHGFDSNYRLYSPPCTSSKLGQLNPEVWSKWDIDHFHHPNWLVVLNIMYFHRFPCISMYVHISSYKSWCNLMSGRYVSSTFDINFICFHGFSVGPRGRSYYQPRLLVLLRPCEGCTAWPWLGIVVIPPAKMVITARTASYFLPTFSQNVPENRGYWHSHSSFSLSLSFSLSSYHCYWEIHDNDFWILLGYTDSNKDFMGDRTDWTHKNACVKD